MKFNKKRFRMMKKFKAKGVTKSTVIQKHRAIAVAQSNLDQVKYLRAKTGLNMMTAELVVNTYKEMGKGKKPSMKAMINFAQGYKIEQFLLNMDVDIEELLSELEEYDDTITQDVLFNPERWEKVGAYKVTDPFTSLNGTIVKFHWSYNSNGTFYTITGKKLKEKADEKA